jgi:hypothetical protein
MTFNLKFTSGDLIDQYHDAANNYLQHLMDSIDTDFGKINWILIQELAGVLNMTLRKEMAGHNVRCLYFNLDETKKQEINNLLDNNNLSTVKLALQKFVIIQTGINKLLLAQSQNEEEKQETADDFKLYINENKNLLITRRDTLVVTFLKVLGVIAATCLPFIGNFFAHRYTFGDKATHGHLFLEQIGPKSRN